MISLPPLPPTPAAHAQAAISLANPDLSSTLRLEYDCLVSDLRRAQDLCAEFQRQLEGKSSEVNELKELFAKTQSDLFQLQDSIVELREERHRLANEAMRAGALARQLFTVTEERDRLRGELSEITSSASLSCASAAAPGEMGSDIKGVVSDMWRTLLRLQTILDSEEFCGESVNPVGENKCGRIMPFLQAN